MSTENPMQAMLRSQHARAVARQADDPDDRLASLLVKNRAQALADLHAEQRLEDARKSGELFELRLHGPKVDRGAIPLDALIKVASPFLRALKAAAERQRYGAVKVSNKFKRMVSDSLNIKLAGVGSGSTRLLLTGDGVTDTSGVSLLHITLEKTLGLLNTSGELFFEAIDAIGIRSANALCEFAEEVEKAGMSIDITWPYGEKPMYWEGRSDELIRIKNLLKSIENIKETQTELDGEVVGILASGRLRLEVVDLGKISIRFSHNQTHIAQQLVIRKQARLKVMVSTYWDPAKQAEVSKYNLL